MRIFDDITDKVDHLVGKAKDQHTAREEKAEADIEPDAAVAGSRAGIGGEDGTYVGRTNPPFDAEVQESGAEARSEAARLDKK